MLNRRTFLQSAVLAPPAWGAVAAKPNVVIIFLDDSGYADFHPFGNPPYPTPNVERLAKQGCAFHNFYVPQAICSASRSALLTGCYPGRTKMFGAHGPGARGVDPQFATLGQVLRKAGHLVQEHASGESFFTAYKPGADACLLLDGKQLGSNCLLTL